MPRIGSRRVFSIPARELFFGVPSWECHVHSVFTDGDATVEDCVQKAYEMGISRIIFTEHVEPWKAKKDAWFGEYVRAVRSVAQQYEGKIDVFLGVEAPALDFEKAIELTEEMRNEADFVLGTAHRYPGLNSRSVRSLSKKEFVSLEFKTLIALANNPYIDAIAHMGGTCRQYCCEFPEDLVVEVVKQARENGVAIELNSRYHKPISHLLEICMHEGAEVTIGSDAHSLGEIGIAFKSILKALKEIAK